MYIKGLSKIPLSEEEEVEEATIGVECIFFFFYFFLFFLLLSFQLL